MFRAGNIDELVFRLKKELRLLVNRFSIWKGFSSGW